MVRSSAWLVICGVLCLCCHGPKAASAQEPAKSAEEVHPESALVVFEVDGKLTAVRVEKQHQLAVLESCFPNYQSRPAGEGTTSWKPKYEVYFNFPRGQTIRLLVSSNSRYWSAGQGPLEMRGMYFSGVIHELLKALPNSNDR